MATAKTITPAEWINTIHPGAQSGWLEFRALPSKERRWVEVGQTFVLPRAWGNQNVYYGVALRSESGKGTANDLLEHNLLWADIDLKNSIYLDGDPKEASPSELRGAVELLWTDTQNLLEDVGITPRAVVYSGHGLQLIFAVDGVLNGAETEARTRWLTDKLGGDPAACDRARILRFPSSKNVKNPNRPIEVEVWFTSVVVNSLELFGRIEREHIQPKSGEYQTDGKITENDTAKIIELWEKLRGKHDTNSKGRHYLALYVAGWLKRNSVSEPDAIAFVSHCATTADDEELDDRLECVRSTYASSQEVRGWEGLKADFGLELEGIALARGVKAGAAVAEATGGKTGGKPRELTLLDYAALCHEIYSTTGQALIYLEPQQTWWKYGNGVYSRVLEQTMLREIDGILQRNDHTNMSSSKLKEVLLKLGHMDNVVRSVMDLGNRQLNVKNGILNLETLELTPHSPDFFSAVQCPAIWDETATAPQFMAFLKEVLPRECDREAIQEFFGYALTADMDLQKALVLIGKGGTGKGTIVSVLQALLGGDSSSALWAGIDLEEFKDNTPGIERLLNKRALLISEISSVINWLTFKRLTGQDTLTVNPKFRPTFDVRLTCKIIISSNVLPRLGEDSTNDSLTRRFIPIEFNQQPEVPDTTLRHRITTERELSGILAWCVAGLHRLYGQKGFTEPAGALKSQMLEQSNRIITWLQEDQIFNNGATPAQELYNRYLKWCDDTRHKAVSSTRFGSDLIAAAAQIGWTPITKTRKISGITYEGVSL
jgi:putative DNA primase/helicase